MSHKLIEDFLVGWKVKRGRIKTNETIKTYRTELENFFQFVQDDGGDPEKLTETDSERYFKFAYGKKTDEKTGKKYELSISTKQKIYTVINTYLHYIGKPKYMELIEYPEKDKSVPIKPKGLDKNEINKLKRGVENFAMKSNKGFKKGGKMNITLIFTLLYTGVRIHELVGLNIKENLELQINKGKLKFIGKGGKYREVPFDKTLASKLNDYLADRTDDNPALFITNRGERMSVRNAQDLVKRIGDSCGLPNLHPHALRHTFCYQLAKDPETPITTVAEYAGHSDINTTRLYTTPDENDGRAAIERALQ